jgi:3-deoxy-D-manno-octulosonic-acid transferase
MRTLYNILFTTLFVLSSPYYFLKMYRRGGWREGFRERFGNYSTGTKQAITNRQVLWIHAVSVGEVNVCTQLIAALEPRVPNLKIVVSTTTSTGMGELDRKLPSHIEKIYYPIDRYRYVARALATFQPKAVVLVEAEIWPNFLWRIQDRNIPLFLVNARLSEKSFRGYRRFGFLFRDIFAGFNGVGAQNEADAARLRELGVRPETIRIVGSLKFDAARIEERRPLDASSLLRQLGVPEGAPVILGASTHAGEETILAQVFLKLRKTFPNLFLVVVPRHHERGREVGEALTASGLKFAYRSSITASTRFQPGDMQALLVNTTGELRYFYGEATVAFVGKSLTAEGGQNPIEPAALGCPILFGPNMQNFEPIATQFVTQGGARRVANASDLEHVLAEVLSNPALRQDMVTKARQVVRENQGAIARTVDMIVAELETKGLFVA